MANTTIYKKLYILRGVLNGTLCALGISIWVVISFYVNFNNVHLFTIGIPLSIITYFLLKDAYMEHFFSTWGISILTYAVVQIIISSTGVINYFYSQAVGDGIGMTAGDGFGIMVIHIFNYAWITLGTIGAFIQTIFMKKRISKHKN